MNEIERLTQVIDLIRGTELEQFFAVVGLGAISGICNAVMEQPTSPEQARLLTEISKLAGGGMIPDEPMMVGAGGDA